jgi:drug/metabolite transporter (DMT)-like permease
MPKTKKAAGEACLAITAVIWGLAFVAQRVGMSYVSPLTYNAVRFALGGLSLVPVIFIFERGSARSGVLRRTISDGALCGVVLFASSAAQQIGINITDSASKGSFITGLYIVLVPLARLLTGGKPSPFILGGAAVSAAGLYLISTPETGVAGRGDMILMVGTLGWTVHILLVDRSAGRIAPVTFSMVQFFVCAGLSLAGALVFEEAASQDIIGGMGTILYGGIMSAGVAYTLQVVGQQRVEPSRAAIILTLEMPCAALGAAVVLGEVMNARGYAGCAMIFAGIVLSQLDRVMHGGSRGNAEENGQGPPD